MWPGPRDPDLGAFVAQVSRELARLGHDVDHAVLDSRRGGPARHLRLLARSARAKRADVVFAHFLVPTGLSALLGNRAPLVVMAHGQDVANAERLAPVRSATRLVVRRAAAVIANSRHLAARLEALTGVQAEVVDCGVDMEAFSPGVAAGRTGRSPPTARASCASARSCRARTSCASPRRSDASGAARSSTWATGPQRVRSRRAPGRPPRGPGPPRPGAGVDRRLRRPLPALAARAVRPGGAGGHGDGQVGRRDPRGRPAGVREPGRGRDRRPRPTPRRWRVRWTRRRRCRRPTRRHARRRACTTCAARPRGWPRSSSAPQETGRRRAERRSRSRPLLPTAGV